MKLLGKTLRITAVIMIAVITLVACKKESDKTDLFAIDSNLAQKTLLGNYVSVKVDSTNLITAINEWKLENGASGRVGVYKKAAAGNGVETFTVDSLTWSEAVMSDDKLYFTVPVVLNGESLDLIWRDGVIETDDYVTTKQVISIADIMQGLSADFGNLDYVYDDTVFLETVTYDSIPFLWWDTKVVEYSLDEIEAYKQYLLTMADTIAWFNENYPPSVRGANAEIPDTVRFSTKPLASGLYRGLIPLAVEDTAILSDTTNHGPSLIVNSEIVFNRDDNKKNTGSYAYRLRTWSDEYYLNPESPKAIAYDSIFTLDNTLWTLSSFTNSKKFVATMKGKQTVDVDGKKTEKANAFVDFQFSNFNKADGTIEFNGFKYKLK